MLSRFLKFAVFGALAGVCASAEAEEAAQAPLELYIDADYSISASAAQSIELGVRTALEEVEYQVAGTPLRIVPMDHRGNVKRARRTYDDYLRNNRALAVVGGMHSPPYLANRDYINTNQILTLLPWSAAGPITRASDGHENWIFRLSVDDTKSSSFLVGEVVEKAGCNRVALILIETGWGRANLKTLTAALAQRSMSPVAIEFFSTAIGEASALSLAGRIERSGADCGVLLAHWDDGAIVLNALHTSGTDINVFSHWGIMGGEFPSRVSDETRRALRLRVLQTCGLRRERQGEPRLAAALARATPEAASLADLPAPTGFVHAYDLTRVLIEAANQAAQTEGWSSGDITAKRRALHHALEQLDSPVAGILGRYAPPFQPYSPQAPDAHEALGQDDLCIAKFRSDGRLEDAD